MKNKTKKIIAVVVAVLFSFTIIGTVIVSIVAPKNNAVMASADTVATLSDTSDTISDRPPMVLDDINIIGLIYMLVKVFEHVHNSYSEVLVLCFSYTAFLRTC